MKKATLDILMALGLVLSLMLGGIRSFAQDCESVHNEVLRLHIPANSNSADDQRMKLRLRDHILTEYGAQLSEESDIAAATQRIQALLPEIEADCCEFLRENGADYEATAELTEMYFSTRTYEDVTLPAGEYTALRITLGTGEGNNWWCVMFPPLCIPAVSEPTEELPDTLYGKDETVEIKFAVFELLKRWLKKT